MIIIRFKYIISSFRINMIGFDSATNLIIFLVGMILFVLTFLFSVYFFNRGKLKTFVIFDIAFFFLFFGLLWARILGMINAWGKYSSLGINLIPLEESVNGIAVVDAFPWEFFKINDGNLFIWGIPIGIILGIVIIYFFSNKSKSFLSYADDIILAFLPAKLVLLITQLISLVYYGKQAGLVNVFIPNEGGVRANLALIEIVLFAIIFVVLLFIKSRVKKPGYVFYMYLIYEIVVGFLLLSEVSYSNVMILDLHTSQVVSLILAIVVVVIFVVDVFQSILITRKKRLISKTGSQSPESLIGRSDYNDIELEKNQKGFFKKITSIFKK